MFAVYEGPLAYEIGFSASEAFSHGVMKEGRLLPDSAKRFAAWPAQRIVPYLRVPRSSLRATACLVLAGKASRDPAGRENEWSGIPAAVARMLSSETNDAVADHGVRALGLIPNWSEADLDAVAAVVERSPDHRAVELVHLLEKKWTRTGVDAGSTLTRWANAAGPLRGAAVVALARSFPSADATTARLLPAAAEEPVDGELDDAAQRLLLRRPAAGLEWLKGDEASRALALAALVRDFDGSGPPSEPVLAARAVAPKASPVPNRSFRLPAELTNAAAVVAAEALRGTPGRLRTQAVKFLARSPAGRHTLAETAVRAAQPLLDEIVQNFSDGVPQGVVVARIVPGFAVRIAGVALAHVSAATQNAWHLLRRLPPLPPDECAKVLALVDAETKLADEPILEIVAENSRPAGEAVAALARRWSDSPDDARRQAALVALSNYSPQDDDLSCRLAERMLSKPVLKRDSSRWMEALGRLMQRRPDAFLRMLDRDPCTQRQLMEVVSWQIYAEGKPQRQPTEGVSSPTYAPGRPPPAAIQQKLRQLAPVWLAGGDFELQGKALEVYFKAGLLNPLLKQMREKAAGNDGVLQNAPPIGARDLAAPSADETELRKLRDLLQTTTGRTRRELTVVMFLLFQLDGWPPQSAQRIFLSTALIPDLFDRDDRLAIDLCPHIASQSFGRLLVTDSGAVRLAAWMKRRLREETNAAAPKLHRELFAYFQLLSQLQPNGQSIRDLREEFPALMQKIETNPDPPPQAGARTT